MDNNERRFVLVDSATFMCRDGKFDFSPTER
jgi:hypothetical protein